MRISIDTTTDSHDHIKKVIDLLRNIVNDTSSSSVVTEQPGSPFGDMFGDNTPPAQPDPQPDPHPNPQPDSPSEPDPTGTVPGAPQTRQPSSTLDQSAPSAVDIWGNKKEPDPDVETY